MARYEAVIFDLFGTLVNTVSPAVYDGMLADLADALGVPFEPFMAEWRRTIHERESGAQGDMEGVLRATAAGIGHEPPAASVTSATQTWLRYACEWLEPRADALTAMQRFRDAGNRVGLLSNCSAEIPPLWPTSPLSALVDAPVFSCETGMMKPDARLYAHVCKLLDVSADRCMFVGDGGSRELTGAAAVGMEAVLLRVPGEEHTWFDSNYRVDALEWQGTTIASLGELTPLL